MSITVQNVNNRVRLYRSRRVDGFPFIIVSTAMWGGRNTRFGDHVKNGHQTPLAYNEYVYTQAHTHTMSFLAHSVLQNCEGIYTPPLDSFWTHNYAVAATKWRWFVISCGRTLIYPPHTHIHTQSLFFVQFLYATHVQVHIHLHVYTSNT